MTTTADTQVCQAIATTKGARLAREANTSSDVAQAYRLLAEVISTDPRFASIVEGEYSRALSLVDEYEDDAADRREQALAAGYSPQ